MLPTQCVTVELEIYMSKKSNKEDSKTSQLEELLRIDLLVVVILRLSRVHHLLLSQILGNING